MECNICGAHMQVVDTRHPDPQTVWRRRRCLNCRHLLHTLEVPKMELDYLYGIARKLKILTATSDTPHETPLDEPPLTGGQTESLESQETHSEESSQSLPA